jgi:membrane protease YdiL (CAAX protease family)
MSGTGFRCLMSRFIRSRPLLSFYVLACGLSWMIAGPLMLSRRGLIGAEISDAWEMLAAFGPFSAAFLVTLALSGRPGVAGLLNSLVNWRVRPAWFLFCVFSPGLLLLAAIMIVLVATGKMPDFESAQARSLATLSGLFELVIVAGLIQGLGEEPGWRGFAIARLRQRFGPLAASLCLFPVWLLWHVPMFLTRPEFGLVQWLGFSLGILSATIWLTLIWDATQSLLMVVIWHTLINIHRSIALAVSTPLFLAIGNAVLAGAVIIVIYWLVSRAGSGRRTGQDRDVADG